MQTRNAHVQYTHILTEIECNIYTQIYYHLPYRNSQMQLPISINELAYNDDGYEEIRNMLAASRLHSFGAVHSVCVWVCVCELCINYVRHTQDLSCPV